MILWSSKWRYVSMRSASVRALAVLAVTVGLVGGNFGGAHAAHTR